MYNSLLNEYIGVHLIDMDSLVKEQVVSNPDGSFSIFINARLSADQQMKAYHHALSHIINSDFEKEDVNQIETDTHRMKSYEFHTQKK